MEAGRQILTRVWEAALARVDAEQLTRAALAHDATVGPWWLVALGKAAAPMVLGAAAGRPVTRCVVASGPWAKGQLAGHLALDAEVLVGEHPVPGPGSLAAGRRLLALGEEAQRAGARVIALVSGGGSALVEHPAAGLTAGALSRVHAALVSSGAPIEEINVVRRALSSVKAGGLARAFGPALRRVLVLADVVSGRPEDVASGPFTAAPPAPGRALSIVQERHLEGLLPKEVVARLADPLAREETCAPPAEVLATPATLAEAAAAVAREAGLGPVSLRPSLVSQASVPELAEEVERFLRGGPGLWIAAGEVGLEVPPDAGEGGRAAHLALEVAARRAGSGGPWAFLAGASDGRDGRRGAGAALDEGVALDPAALSWALARYESAAFHARHRTALPGGAPRTNLTDLYLAARW